MEGKMTLWELAENAEAEVKKWPRWKRNAADLALTTPKEDRAGAADPGLPVLGAGMRRRNKR